MLKNKMKNGTFIAMCVVTVLFIVMPLFLQVSVIRNAIAWILSGLKYQEYKSAYLGLIGGLLGSWLAITGAIYTQRKFDREKEKKRAIEEKRAKEIDKENIKEICREMLWSEIYQNDYSLSCDNCNFIKAVIEKNSHYSYSAAIHRITIDNWRFVRNRVISMDLELAIKLMHLYKYYEFMTDFEGSGQDAFIKSQLDFGKYKEYYQDVVEYLEFPWANDLEEGASSENQKV